MEVSGACENHKHLYFDLHGSLSDRGLSAKPAVQVQTAHCRGAQGCVTNTGVQAWGAPADPGGHNSKGEVCHAVVRKVACFQS